MLNYIWAFMIILAIAVGAFNGKMGEVSTEALDSSKEAVSLCITMLGVMSMWTGLMGVARGCGLMEKLTRLMNPLIRILFPSVPKGHRANEYIASNMIANILGLGWAATPVGIKAIKELKVINGNSSRASVGLKLPEPLTRVFVGGRKYIGIFCVIAGVLHFIFPRVLFL